MESIGVHAIFVALFAVGLFLICHKGPGKRNPNEAALTKAFAVGFIVMNGLRWAIFFLPAGFMS